MYADDDNNIAEKITIEYEVVTFELEGEKVQMWYSDFIKRFHRLVTASEKE